MKEGMHDVVKQVPTVMWLPPVVQNSDGEEEEGDDKAEEDLECDGHRRRLFFSVVQATETKSQEELLIYSAVEGGDDEFIYNCNSVCVPQVSSARYVHSFNASHDPNCVDHISFI